MANIQQVTREYTLRSRTEGVAETIAATQRLGAGLDVVATKSETLTRSQESARSAVERHSRTLDVAYRSAQQYAMVLRDLDRAVQQNVISSTRQSELLALAAQRYGQESSTSAARAADIAAYGRQLDELRAKYNPLFAAGQQYKQTLTEITQAAKVGAISEAERATAVMRTKEAFTQQVSVLRGVRQENASVGGSLTQLSFQLNDIASGVAMGQSPFTIMAQQGGQVFQVWQMNNNVFKELGSLIAGATRYITPFATAFGLVAVSVGTAVAALISFQSTQKDIARGLFGVGAASGATASSINKIAGGAVGGLSVREARELATALAATGKIGVDAIAPIVALGKNLAIALGVDAKEANDLLAKSFSDPVKGAQELNQSLGFLDAKTRDLIEHLTAQGNRQSAIKVLTDAMAPSLERASELTSIWARAWNSVSTAASNAFDWVGKALDKAISGGSLEERLNALTAVRNDKALMATPRLLNFGPSVADLDKQIAEIKSKIDKARSDSQAAAARMRSLEVQTIIDSYSQDAVAAARLRDTVINLNSAMKDPAIAEHVKSLQGLRDALARAEEASNSFKGAVEKEAASQKIALDSITAYSPAAKAAIAERQTLLTLAGQSGEAYTAEQKQVAATNAALIARKQAEEGLSESQRDRILGSHQAVESATLEVKLVGRDIEEQEKLRAKMQQRHQMEQEAEKSRLLVGGETIAQGGKLAQMDEAKLKRLDVEIEKTAALKKLEAERVALSTAEFEKSQLFRSPIEQDVASKARAIYGDKYKEQLDGALAQQVRLNGYLKQSIDLSGEFSSSFVQGLMQGKTAVESLQQALSRVAASMAEIGTKSLSQSLVKGLSGGGFSFDPVSLGIGAAGGLLSLAASLFDNKAKKAHDEAIDAWHQMAGQFHRLVSDLSGLKIGSLQQSLEDATARAQPIYGAALKAGDTGAMQQIADALVKFYQVESQKFFNSFEGTIAALNSGLGPDSPFAGGADRVKQLSDAVEGFLSDTINSLGGGGTDAARRAADASAKYLLSLLQVAPALSETQKQLQTLKGMASELSGGLQALGMSAADAATAISVNLAGAIDALRAQFVDTLTRDINAATGKGFLNDIGDLVTKFRQMQADAKELGADPSLLTRWLDVSAQKIVDDAQLTGQSFDDLIAAFPLLQDAVHEFTSAMTRSAADIAQAQQSYQDQTFVVGQDQTTLPGQLAVFDLQAQRAREEEIAKGGQAIVDLEALQAAQRFNIIKQWNDKAAEEAQRAAEAAARAADQAAQEAARAAEQAAQEMARVLAEAAAKAAADLKRRQSFQDQTFTLGQDQNTLAGALAVFMRQSMRAVQEEVAQGGAAIVDLEALQAAQRYDIIKKFNEKALADLKRTQSFQDQTFALGQDQSTLAGQLAVFEREAFRALEDEVAKGGAALVDLEALQAAQRLDIVKKFNDQAKEDTKRAMDEAQSFVAGVTRKIKEYLNSLNTGASSPLSPAARFSAAQTSYNTQLALASTTGTGQRDALDSITQYAGDLLDAAKALYGSSAGFQTIFGQVQSQLGALTTQISPEQFIVTALNTTLTTLQTTLDTTMKTTLKAAMDAGNAAAIATALFPMFNSLDTNTDGLLSQTEFVSGLHGMASDTVLAAMFKTLDTDNSGSISRLELINAAAGNTKIAVDNNKIATDLVRTALSAILTSGNPQAIATALLPQFTTLDTNTDALLTLSEFTSGLHGMASDAALATMFKTLDVDNSGSLSRLDLITTAAGNTTTSVNAAKTSIDATKASVDLTKTAVTATTTSVDLTKTAVTATTTAVTGTTTSVNTTNSISTAIQNLLNTILTGNNALAGIFNNTSGASGNMLWFLNSQNTFLSLIRENVRSANQHSGATDFAAGGLVVGRGTGTSDSILAHVSNGEYIVNAADAARNFGALSAINDNHAVIGGPPPAIIMGDSGASAEMVDELRANRREIAELKRILMLGFDGLASVSSDGTEAIAVRLDRANEIAGDANRRVRRDNAKAA